MNSYREYPPIKGLEQYVECVWLLESSDGKLTEDPNEWHRVFPDLHIDIAIGFGDRVVRRTKTGEPVLQSRACAVGLLSGPVWLKPTGALKTAGIRLRPEGGFAILDMDLSELANSMVPLESLWGQTGRRLVARSADHRSPKLTLLEIQEILRARVQGTRRPHASTVQAIRTLVESGGFTSIRQVAREVGWSERTLERRFLQEVGASPKLLLRTVRFHHLLTHLAKNPKESWATLACDCGFSDQAHLVREVRAFAGCTPSRLDEHDLAPTRLLLPDSCNQQ